MTRLRSNKTYFQSLAQQALSGAWLPLIFFAVLLFTRLAAPPHLSFDEVHYVPASKALILLQDKLNFEHPPLGKLILGGFWLILTKWLHVVGDPASFRLASTVFGLWALLSVYAWMKKLGFTSAAAQAGMWLTGFNFLWFVQSKIAMLDMFSLAFSLWGLFYVYPDAPTQKTPSPNNRWTYWLGWGLLGLAMACKWSSFPFVMIALVFGSRRLMAKILGATAAGVVYLLTFIPLSFLDKGRVSLLDIVSYHKAMIEGFNSIASASHPYISHWWEWPFLIRPIWFVFDTDATGNHCVWAGGNPFLYWLAIPFLILVLWYGLRKSTNVSAQALSLLYWLPLLFWTVAPRKLQLYYYYLPSSMWVGPILVWAHENIYLKFRRPEQSRGRLLLALCLMAAILFFYFLPIMDARPLPPGRFYHYMWFLNWV